MKNFLKRAAGESTKTNLLDKKSLEHSFPSFDPPDTLSCW